jgi:hypothetical protein
LRKHITGTKDPMPWLPNSNKRASGKTGAVHRRSSRFSSPVCCQLSQAGTSSLLRIHLPPHTASVGLESPLVPAWTPSLYGRPGARLPQLLRVSCERPHPQSHRRPDQVWGFAIFCTLTGNANIKLSQKRR